MNNREVWVAAYIDLDDRWSAEVFSTKEAACKFIEDFLDHEEVKWEYIAYHAAENGGDYFNTRTDEQYGFVMRCLIDRTYEDFKEEYMTK